MRGSKGWTLAAILSCAGACGDKPIPLIDAGVGGATSTTSVTTGGDGGKVANGVCGNGIAETGEQCDGEDLFDNTCLTVGGGFSAGELGCTKACFFDKSKCTFIENSCIDGADNDMNGLADCADPQCAGACGEPCSAGAVVTLPDHGSVFADPSGHQTTAAASCAGPGAGPALVFSVTADTTGVLEAILESGADLALSARKACGDVASEVACVDRFLGPGTVQHLKVAASAGDTFFFVVQGHDATDAGTFTMLVNSRPIACGDGFRDGAEGCDDGNVASGDGCSMACALEPTEVEPNDTVATAGVYAGDWVGEIAPAGDVDVVAVTVGNAPASITATVEDLDGHSCDEGGLEGLLEVVGADGATVIAARDAGATNACPSVVAGIATPGTYYVRLRASSLSPAPTFPYRLSVVVKDSVCGNGMIEPLEQCDDANVASGDGCSATCQLEPTESEPNDVVAVANAFSAPWYATIAPAGDVDTFSFTVPAGASQVRLRVHDNGNGDCAAAAIVSRVDLVGPDGTTVLGTSQGTAQDFCAFLLVANGGSSTPIKPGTHYARVRAGQALPMATFTYALSIDVL